MVFNFLLRQHAEESLAPEKPLLRKAGLQWTAVMVSSFALSAALLLAPMPGRSDDSANVTMKLLASGATAKTGGYRPIRAEMSATSTAKVNPANLTAASYGVMKFGAKTIAFALDEPAGADPKFYLDANGDGDLTNDPAVSYKARKNGATTVFLGEGNVDLGKGEPVAIKFYRFDPKDPKREALKNTLLYYGDFGYEITIQLDKKPYTSFLAGEPDAESSFTVDRDGNGKISYKLETIQVGQPFNFTGTTYQLEAKNGALALNKLSKSIPKAPLPPDVTIGKKALKFDAVSLDGKKVSFPRDYKGKLVMLDFWATWCGPCIGEIPNVKAAYAKWHDQGFEILGVSFDDKDFADKVKEFTAKYEMPWRQIYEGKGWNTDLGGLYDVSAIPFVLLVDGDTGEILGNEATLRGPGITDFIGKQLEAKKAKR